MKNENKSIIQISKLITKFIILFFFLLFKRKPALKKKINVGILGDLGYGGFGRFNSYLGDMLINNKKYNIVFISSSYGLKGYPLNSNITLAILTDYKDLVEIIKKNNIKIFIFQLQYDFINYFKLREKTGVKLIGIYHGAFLGFINNPDKYFVDNYANLHLYNKTDISFAIVEDDIPLWRKKGVDKFYYMPNFLPKSYYNIEPSKLITKNILLMGRGDDFSKNFQFGYHVLYRVLKKVPDARLLVVSGGNLANLKELGKKLGIEKSVDYTGKVNNITIYLLNSSIYLFPCIFEGFGYALAEAKSYGLPNIITAKRYLSLSKKGSIIVEHEDYDSAAQECIKLLQNETYRKEQGNLAKESMKDFSYKEMTKRWIPVFDSLMANDVNKLINSQKFNETKSFLIQKREFEFLKKTKNSPTICFDFDKDILCPFDGKKIKQCN